MYLSFADLFNYILLNIVPKDRSRSRDKKRWKGDYGKDGTVVENRRVKEEY